MAEDGFAALRTIQQAMPDLMITDLRMPNMNGFELLSVIRTRFPKLPTIAISVEFVSVHKGPLADAFFQKGHYEVPKFLGTITELLEQFQSWCIPRQAGAEARLFCILNASPTARRGKLKAGSSTGQDTVTLESL